MPKFKNKLQIGLISFRLGTFLLVSAPVISSLFLLLSLFISISINWKDLFKDKWNYLFLMASMLMIIISIFHTLNLNDLSISIFELNKGQLNEKTIEWDSYSSLIGLANWLPLFLCFWGFQPYLLTSNNRKTIAKFLIAGSVPVLFSAFGQYWFDWHGEMETMRGLIIWFGDDGGSGITSLFSNQNYAGCWLNIVWPFSIALFLENTKSLLKKGSSLIFIISISVASFLTTSRNAWGGLFLTIPLIFGSASFYWIIPIFSVLVLIIFLQMIDIFPESINTLINSLLPNKFNIFTQFAPSNYTDKIYGRDTIFLFALKMISKKPFVGLGAATFPIYYFIENDIYMGHAHNLIIDITFSYGILVAILIFTNILLLCFFSIKKIYFHPTSRKIRNIFTERAWCTSFLVLLLSQMFDVQYFDLRISISFWILLAGMKCIFEDEKADEFAEA